MRIGLSLGLGLGLVAIILTLSTSFAANGLRKLLGIRVLFFVCLAILFVGTFLGIGLGALLDYLFTSATKKKSSPKKEPPKIHHFQVRRRDPKRMDKR